jgi:hypothetical protein
MVATLGLSPSGPGVYSGQVRGRCAGISADDQPWLEPWTTKEIILIGKTVLVIRAMCGELGPIAD